MSSSHTANSMRLIGDWDLSRDAYLPPQEFVWPIPWEDKAKISGYLAHGEVFETFRSYRHCLICDCPLGFRQLADGYWVWPEGLDHYVRDHSVNLPEEFVEDVKFDMRRLPGEQWNPAKPADSTFWIGWCRRNAQGLFTERILQARRDADAQYERWLDAEVRKREQSDGMSNEKCQFMGCERKALRNRAFCARCCLVNPGPAKASRLDWRKVFE